MHTFRTLGVLQISRITSGRGRSTLSKIQRPYSSASVKTTNNKMGKTTLKIHARVTPEKICVFLTFLASAATEPRLSDRHQTTSGRPAVKLCKKLEFWCFTREILPNFCSKGGFRSSRAPAWECTDPSESRAYVGWNRKNASTASCKNDARHPAHVVGFQKNALIGSCKNDTRHPAHVVGFQKNALTGSCKNDTRHQAHVVGFQKNAIIGSYKKCPNRRALQKSPFLSRVH